jgi:hypothetical protein
MIRATSEQFFAQGLAIYCKMLIYKRSEGEHLMRTNYVPAPAPKFDLPQPRQSKQVHAGSWTIPARPFDRTRNARANPSRTYHVETAWEAMSITKPYSGERITFSRWHKASSLSKAIDS